MDTQPTPPELPAEAAKLLDLVDLRDQLKELHAKLEYLRLMLRLRATL
jgi:hypothetical protein